MCVSVNGFFNFLVHRSALMSSGIFRGGLSVLSKESVLLAALTGLEIEGDIHIPNPHALPTTVTQNVFRPQLFRRHT